MKKKDLLKEINSLRRLVGNHLSQIVLLDQKIDDIYRTLKNHGQAHMAQDVTPRVRDLEGKIGLDWQISEEHGKRIVELENGRKDWNDAVYLALRGRVEELEKNYHPFFSLIQEHHKQISDLEKEIKMAEQRHEITDRITRENWKRIGELELGANGAGQSLLKRVESLEKEIKDQREDYRAHIWKLVEENEAAHNKQVKNNELLVEMSNKQAVAIETLQKQFKDQMIINGVLQNAVLKIQNKKKPGRPKKGV